MAVTADRGGHATTPVTASEVLPSGPCHPAPRDLGELVSCTVRGDQRVCIFRHKPQHYILVRYVVEQTEAGEGWFGRRHGDFTTLAEAQSQVSAALR